MGRKKIEIRPLVDERNRNVTFLKRKAGLMKKAWELSVLCAADVSIIIFSAAGKAYEFSSQDLDGEIERYHEYEGMIERRRAPEFAAMALAGEDEDDDEDDIGPRRGAVSNKKGAASAAQNGGAAAPPRSLKGKESFKARTVTHGHGDRNGHGKGKKSKSKGHGKSKDRDRSSSEKRTFIDGILSDESSSDDDGEEDEGRGESSLRRRRDDVDDMERERGDRRRERGMHREAENSYSSSDKMMAGLHYALNMHQVPGQPPSGSGDYAAQMQHRQEAYDQSEGSYGQNTLMPHLPRQPPDAISYRTSSAPTLPLGVSTPHLSASSPYPPSQGSSSAMNYYGQSFPNQGHQHSFQAQRQQQQQQSFQQHSNGAYVPASSAVPPTPTGHPVDGMPMQWDQGLLTRYAEYQLQQNHQKQQRLLLERQRQQLADMGVPVDQRSLLDDIFGGVGGGGRANSASASAGAGAGAATGSSSHDMTSGLPDTGSVAGGETSGEFIWPLANGHHNSAAGAAGGGGGSDGERYDIPESNSRALRRGEGGDMEWGDGGMEDERHGLSLPSPVSNGTGEVQRTKGRGREGVDDRGAAKKVRVI
ncbi:hypothetical protein CI109_100596 [Kwoniella shandongensis]|uniref:Uncharacterized protein n=1 Tax=Kwoniella shandongensis TaxID=1734106 RepID=A0A5M6BZM5_9TREE|nr:uncharacterized protein CI109_003482 [Kwoniella shandongensis]KAA5528193.1 hypothetical protein CI109_003482 [Kwoniella shandongensis]